MEGVGYGWGGFGLLCRVCVCLSFIEVVVEVKVSEGGVGWVEFYFFWGVVVGGLCYGWWYVEFCKFYECEV